MTGADLMVVAVVGAVVVGGVAFVVIQNKKNATASFGPYTQQPGQPTYSQPPLVQAQPAYQQPTYQQPAAPNPANNGGSQYASGEALAWTQTVLGGLNAFGQTAVGLVNAFSGM